MDKEEAVVHRREVPVQADPEDAEPFRRNRHRKR
jgi:hypothetical protein